MSMNSLNNEQSLDATAQSTKNFQTDYPDELICGLCNETLYHPILTTDENEDSKDITSNKRDFHKACIEKYLQADDSHSLGISTRPLSPYELQQKRALAHAYNISLTPSEIQSAHTTLARTLKTILQLGTMFDDAVNGASITPSALAMQKTIHQSHVIEDGNRVVLKLCPELCELGPIDDAASFENLITMRQLGASTAVGLAASSVKTAISAGKISSLLSLPADPVTYSIAIIFSSLTVTYSSLSSHQFRVCVLEAYNDWLSAVRQIDIEKYEQFRAVEEKLHGLFDKSWWFNRTGRWLVLNKTDYAFAHLLRGQNAIQLNKSGHYILAFQEFDKAYRDSIEAKNDDIASLATLSSARLLLNKDSVKSLSTKYNVEQQLKKRLGLIAKQHYPILECYYAKFIELIRLVLICNTTIEPSHLQARASDIERCLSFDEFALVRQMRTVPGQKAVKHESIGQFWEIYTKFLQGILCMLVAHHHIDISENLFPHDETDGILQGNIKQNFPHMKQNMALIKALDLFNQCAQKVTKLKGCVSYTFDDPQEQSLRLMVQYILDIYEQFSIDVQAMPPSIQNAWDTIITDPNSEEFKSGEIGKLIHYYFVIDSDKHFQSLSDILSAIEQNDYFAMLKNDDKKNWFHLLARMRFKPHEKARVPNVVSRLYDLGISPYDRDRHGNTAFHYLLKQQKKRTYTLSIEDYQKKDVGFEKAFSQLSKSIKMLKDHHPLGHHFVILSGPSGTGKTMSVKEFAKRESIPCHNFQRGGADDKYIGQLEKRIIEWFQNAKKANKPQILFIDNIDSICPRKTKSSEGKIAAHCIREEISKLDGTQILVVGCTNNPSKVDKALFSQSINVEIPMTSRTLRTHLFSICFSSIPCQQETIEKLVDASTGWSCRDIQNFSTNFLNERQESSAPLSIDELSAPFNEFTQQVSKVFLSELNASITLPQLHSSKTPQIVHNTVYNDTISEILRTAKNFQDTNVDISSLGERKLNILLYGPPGTGKTTFARLMAQTTTSVFINLDAGRYTNGLRNDELEAIFHAINKFEKAIVFIDEADNCLRDGAPCLQNFITGIDGFEENLNSRTIVIGATNFPERFSEAAQDRFNPNVYMPLPEMAERIKLISIHLNRLNRCGALSDEFGVIKSSRWQAAVQRIAEETSGVSARTIKKVFDLTTATTWIASGESTPITLERLLDQFKEQRQGFKPCF